MKKNIFNNLFLKIVSLILAIFSWLYISDEIAQSKKKEKVTFIWDKELNLEVRELPVRVNIKGSPPPGYVFAESKLVINPVSCKVVGKKIVLDTLEYVETEPIDIRKLTKTTTMKTTIHPLSNLIIPEGEVEVTIPIEKGRR
ncbi:MAG: YbbR-like domain-containing protein [Candidatus Omnitrophica bacterium]|nr:YbbR-like domain-containing protein [Candidatus Omnitrophota bacterium]